MDTIKEWALGITLISFSGGIAFMLLPKGGTAKTVKSIISVIVILSCTIPFLGGKKIESEIYTDNRSDSLDNSEISCIVNRQQLEIVEDKLNNEMEKILKKYSAEAMNIYFDDNIDDDGRIVINKVIVYLAEEYSYLESKIHNDILSVLGIENIIVISDNENLMLSEKEVDG